VDLVGIDSPERVTTAIAATSEDEQDLSWE
jgi:hypothetical protein